MHGDQHFGLEIKEGLDGFLGIHVNGSTTHGLVGADWENGDVDVGGFADAPKAVEVGAVSGVENGSILDFNKEAAELAVQIMDEPRTPVAGGGHLDADLARPGFHDDRFAPAQLDDSAKAAVADEAPHPVGHDDSGIVGPLRGATQFPKTGEMKVIKVGVTDDDEIDSREIFDFHAGAAEATDGTVPKRPVRIKKDVPD